MTSTELGHVRLAILLAAVGALARGAGPMAAGAEHPHKGPVQMNPEGKLSTAVVSLDGEWLLAPDPRNAGRAERWMLKPRPELAGRKLPRPGAKPL